VCGVVCGKKEKGCFVLEKVKQDGKKKPTLLHFFPLIEPGKEKNMIPLSSVGDTSPYTERECHQ
jgi:hypothetical protein